MDMDTRKIQQVGGGTYTVSLPKEWTEKQGVTTGDTVNVHTYLDGLLVIQVEERDDEVPGQVDVEITSEETGVIEQTLRAAYAVGAKEVGLTAASTFTDEQLRTVDRVVTNLTGMSVVESTEESVVVRTMMDTNEVSVRQTVRQLKFVALSMHRDATDALTSEADGADLATRDDQADRLFAMIDRAFARGLHRLDEVDALDLTRPELFELWMTTRELERIADHAECLQRLAGTHDVAPAGAVGRERDIDDLAEQARTLVDDAVAVVVGDAPAERAHDVLTDRDTLRTQARDLESRLSDATGAIRILDRVQRTAEHGGNIAEVGLRQAIREGEFADQEFRTSSRN